MAAAAVIARDLRLALHALPAAAEQAALHGMLAFGWEQCHRLDAAEAAAGLLQALPRLAAIGRSHAQRELFEQLGTDALQRAGQRAAVQNLLQPRANAMPQPLRRRRRLQVVNAGLGLPH